METLYNEKDFCLYYTKQFREDFCQFLRTYDACHRFWNNPKEEYKIYHSFTKSSKFWDSGCSNDKLFFVTCLAYILEFENIFSHLADEGLTFESCEAFCRIMGYPLVLADAGGPSGTWYQLRNFRLIPFDKKLRKKLTDIIYWANDYIKEYMRAFIEGNDDNLLGNKYYIYLLTQIKNRYADFDSFWHVVEYGINWESGVFKIYSVDPKSLIGYREWVRKQYPKSPKCKAFDYFLDKKNGYEKDFKNFLLKIEATYNNGFVFAKPHPYVAFEKLSDTKEKDVYFRVCWQYFCALLANIQRADGENCFGNKCKELFVRLIGFPVVPSGFIRNIIFHPGLGLTPEQTELYCRTLDDISWPMEKLIRKFLTNKLSYYADCEDYQNLVSRTTRDADYIWENILDTIDSYKKEVVKVEITDCSIKIKTNIYHSTDPIIELIKVESVQGDFYIGKTTVQWYQWKELMNLYSGNARCPVTGVSPEKIQLFINRLSHISGLHFRLPTVKEWIYAAKGGNKSKGFKFAGSDDLEEVAWCRYNSEHKIHDVGKKKPNELGLYDMSGNVWEIVLDEKYEALFPEKNNDMSDKVWEIVLDEKNKYSIPMKSYDIGFVCGGCAHDKENYCKIDNVSTFNMNEISVIGFRLACSL